MKVSFALDTPDLDQARELVGELIAPFGLTPCRKAGYRARIRAGRLGALRIADVSYRGAVDIVSDVPADAHILEIPMAGFCRAQRETVTRDAGLGDVIATASGQRVRTWMSDGSRLLIIRIPDDVLHPSGHRLAQPAANGWAPAPSMPPHRLASIERLARLVFEEHEGVGPLQADDGLGRELQYVMLALLGATVVRQHGPGPSEERGAPLPRSVRQAQALMIAASDGGLTLEALAKRCGVGMRTLQENFRQFTGVTPGEWWRGYRLDCVRVALGAGATEVSVTETATAFGFNHLGRFAGQYRRRFGEAPSETLRRAAATGSQNRPISAK